MTLADQCAFGLHDGLQYLEVLHVATPGDCTDKVLNDMFAHFAAQWLIVQEDSSDSLSFQQLSIVNTKAVKRSGNHHIGIAV